MFNYYLLRYVYHNTVRENDGKNTCIQSQRKIQFQLHKFYINFEVFQETKRPEMDFRGKLPTIRNNRQLFH